MRKKILAGIQAPYAGNGKLTIYKNKNDSWIYRQMKNGEYEPGIDVLEDDTGNIKFAKVARRLTADTASERCGFYFDKSYEQLSSVSSTAYRFKLSWLLKSNSDGMNVDEINVLSSLLVLKCDDDLQKLNVNFNISMTDIFQPSFVDFDIRCIQCCAIISIENNINLDRERIFQYFDKLGFSSGESLI